MVALLSLIARRWRTSSENCHFRWYGDGGVSVLGSGFGFGFGFGFESEAYSEKIEASGPEVVGCEMVGPLTSTVVVDRCSFLFFSCSCLIRV